MAAIQAQIAEKLQISQATVSRALRNHPRISHEVRARVLELAAQMGYILPGQEKTPPGDSRESGTFVAVLIHAPEGPSTASAYLVGLSALAPLFEFTLVVHHLSQDKLSSILEPGLQPLPMQRGKVSALLLVHRWPPEIVEALSRKYRCVSLMHEYRDLAVDVVTVNHGRAMDRLVGHLESLGHRKFGFFGYAEPLSWSRARYAGYIEALLRRTLAFHHAQTIELSAPLLEGYLQAPQLESQWEQAVEKVREAIGKGVRAWLATSDYAARHLIERLRASGLRVPEDVSVTGFDALAGEASSSQPALTSIKVPHELLGRAALRMVKTRLSSPSDAPLTILYESPLVSGGSTGPLLRQR